MSAVLLALFKDHDTAERVRIELVGDGFPTDRVDVTSNDDLGHAALEPADGLRGKLAQYFSTLLDLEAERDCAKRFADSVEHGATAVAIHPRGTVEIERAAAILRRAGAQEVAQHDLMPDAWEQAAARSALPWVRNLWIENTSGADCIYCRLFPTSEHPH